jgi:hypothetical protein
MKKKISKEQVWGSIVGTAFTVTTVFGLPMLLPSCDNGTTQQEQAKEQTGTINNLFGKGFSVTVKGNFTNTEWGSGTTGIVGKIEAALNNAYEFSYNFGGPGEVFHFDNAFQRDGVTIIIEKTSEYKVYKTIGNGIALYINFAMIDELTPVRIRTAVSSLSTNETIMVKAPMPQYNRAMQLRDNRIASKMVRQRLG